VLEKIVAVPLPLRPIAKVVRLDHPKRSLHADQRARPNHASLKPFRALEGSMNQAPVEADRVTRAHRESKHCREDR
jgi:hypothetical protein